MAALQLFPWRESDPLIAFAQQIVEFVVVTALVYTVGRFVAVPATNWLLEVRRVEPTLASAARKFVRTGVLLVAIVSGAGFAGFTGLLGGSALLAAAATVALGFAAQEAIGNFIAGMFIVRDRQFNIGDWIEWEDNVGIIDEITFRVTRIRTFDNEMVTVPNADLATSVVTNRMSNESLRVTCKFGIDYGTDVQEAKDILLAVADEHPCILEEPSPSVQVSELAGDSIDLQSRFWIDDPSRRRYLTVRSEFLEQAVERLTAADIGIGTVTDLSMAGKLDVQSAYK